jgi:predicted alpha/beta-hydrolase family hydrolase
MVNLRIGSIAGHPFYPAGKPEDPRSDVPKSLQ